MNKIFYGAGQGRNSVLGLCIEDSDIGLNKECPDKYSYVAFK
jgi:hypothetical protein